MALCDLLNLSEDLGKKQGISEERILEQIDSLRDAFAFYREYPDMFVEFLCGENPKNFHLYFYQRCVLRAFMRHRLSYATFPRAFSKSFLALLTLCLRCILYPGAKLFITTGGQAQAAGIAREKVEELCDLIPGLKKEIDWRPGKTLASKDMVRYLFKNGSILDVMAGKATSRGKRKHGRSKYFRLPRTNVIKVIIVILI